MPRGWSLSLHLRKRISALLQPAARVSCSAVGSLHDGRREAGVPDREELLAELHDQLRAPGELYRSLAGAADVDGDAGAFRTWRRCGTGADPVKRGWAGWRRRRL